MQFVNAALQRLTLHVTTAPTLGRSWDSLSLTTDTTGSCRTRHEGQRRAQLVHRITSRTPSDSNSPSQPSLQGGRAGWALLGRSSRAAAALTSLSSLFLSRQPASEEKMKP